MKTIQQIVPGLLLVPALLFVGCSRQEQPAAANPNAPLHQSLTAPAPASPQAGALTPVPATTTPSAAQRMDSAAAPIETAAAPATRHRVVTEEEYRPRYVTKKRSKKKSAAIIGGSAGAGAAIGALAGGGKGAAIGALVGGAGGLIYDRTTAKKRERVD